jgi:hypothetical protein
VAVFTTLPAPAAPTGFTATAMPVTVQLRWDAVNGPVANYRLERADASGNFIVIAGAIAGDASSFTDGSARPGTTYTYRLTALNYRGASSPVTTSVTTGSPTHARLTVTISGNGTVASTPAGIACTAGGGDCSEVYPANTQVMLTATPGAGMRFDGFGGDADCADGVVLMTRDLTCSAAFVAVTGQGWVLLGGAPITDRSQVSPTPSLAVDAGGVPHVAYRAAFLGDVPRLHVARFDGAAWQPLGGALNAGSITAASDPSLAFSPAGMLHVAWSQGNGIQQNVFVARYSGGAWESVGAAGVPLNYVAGSRAVGPSLGFDASGLPMVAWIENGAVKFKRFTGVAWVPALGAGGAEGPASSGADRVRLSDQPEGVPVIAWTEGAGTARALKVVRGFDFAALGTQVNAALAPGEFLDDFGVLGGVPDAIATVVWAQQSASGFSIFARRFDQGAWNDFVPIVNGSADTLLSLAMARRFSSIAYSSGSAHADASPHCRWQRARAPSRSTPSAPRSPRRAAPA